MINFKSKKGITLISLVITLMVLFVMAGIVLVAISNDNGIISKASTARENHLKQQAKEELEFILDEFEMVIVTSNEYTYDLQGLANYLCNNDNIEYLTLNSQQIASLSYVNVTAYNSIYVKLNKYKYEFKIDRDLDIESITNISTQEVSIVSEKDILVSYSSEGWISDDVTATAKNLKGADSLIQVSVDGTNWTDGNSYTREDNGDIYFRIKDSNEYTKVTIRNIDKSGPEGDLELLQYQTSNIVIGASIKVTNITDNNQSGIDYESSRYVLSQSSSSIGTQANLYTDGSLSEYTIDGTSCYLDRGKSNGNYYLHVLFVDNLGNAREVISNNSINIDGIKDFACTGSVQEINLPKGNYKIECWGAQGGSTTSEGGKGAYTVGNIAISKITTFNVVVGSTTTNYKGGYNGGGDGAYDNSSTYARGGGGATDIRVTNKSILSRIMVAAGGGAASHSNDSVSHEGGAAGGLNGYGEYFENDFFPGGSGGKQTSGGYASGYESSTSGSFGTGGKGYVYNGDKIEHTSGGGGGGYYGGGRWQSWIW